ncbi:MAG: hypothetical protein U0871_12425 [Gemmataceae bacterium]
MSWSRVTVAGLAVFAALSATDFMQTFALVETTGGRVVEGNPVAAEWLDRYGWAGLAAFKAASVLVVCGVIFLLARHRPPAGALVTAVGCLALISVTTYSHNLLASTPPADEVDLVAVCPGCGPSGPRPASSRRPLPPPDLDGPVAPVS